MDRVHVRNGIELYCQDLGDGPAVVLVHGGAMSHRVWESQVYALLEAGYRVVTPDLRGHGASDKPVSSYTAEMYADDLAGLTEAIGLEEFALIGWSLGATVVSTFARDYGDRLTALGLVSSSIFESLAIAARDEGERRLPLEQMIANQRRGRPRGMERFVSGMFAEEPDEWTRRWLWAIGMETPMRVAIKTLEIYRDPDADALCDALAGLDCPGGVFHGAKDHAASLTDAEFAAAEVFTDGTFVPFESSGHVPFIEEAERFDEELVAFLP